MRNSIMSRLLLLCSLVFFPAQNLFPVVSADIASGGWYDQQFSAKRIALAQHQHSSSQRDAVIAVSLLDSLCELREHVSQPLELDKVIAQVAADKDVSPWLRSEAESLASAMAQHEGKNDSTFSAKAASIGEVLRWISAQKIDDDPELLEAASEIRSFHRQIILSNLQNAAEVLNSPVAWYRLAKSSNDDFNRAQALRHTLELDSTWAPAALDMANRYLSHGQPTRARELLTKVLERYPEESSIRVLLAQMEINAGRTSSGIEMLSHVLSAPTPIAVERQAAELDAQIGFLSQARELARHALEMHADGREEQELVQRLDEEARDLNALSADSRFRKSEIEQVSAEDNADPQGERLRGLLNGEPSAAFPDSEFLADVPELLRNWKLMPAKARTESRVLSDVRVDRLREDYQSTQHVQQLIAIGSRADALAYTYKSIQYVPESQQLNVLRVQVHRVDGRIVEAEDDGEAPVADASVAMYYDLRAHQYRFPDLQPGDVIEMEYTISPVEDQNPYGHYFAQIVGFSGPLPCEVQRYVLRTPVSISLHSAEHLLAAAQVRHVGKENVYVWERRNAPALVRELRSPSLSEQGAYVHVSNFASWDDLGSWYANLVRPQFKLDEQLEALAAQMVARHPNKLERISAIYDLVLRNTRYVALEFGVYGFKPYPVTQTYARKFGDCKDKASLMVALLRAAGIDADLALVRTQPLGEILPTPASASIFDHAIVYVPGFDLWLDGTAEFSQLRELPVEDEGALALTIDADGHATLRRTPRSSAADNYSRRTIHANVSDQGVITFTGATYVRGEDAPELRRKLDPQSAKLDYVRDRLAQVLPAVEVQKVDLPENLQDAVSLTFTGDLPAFPGNRIVSLPSSWMARNYLETLTSGNLRSQDLLLDAPWTTEEEIGIEIPRGSHVLSLPHDRELHTSFGEAQIKYYLKGDQLTILSRVEFKQTRISPAEYSAFRDFAASLEEAFRRDIQLELP
jgi:cellulose synthase operon protein C